MSFLNSSPLRLTIAVLLAACSSNSEPRPHPTTRLQGAALGAVEGMGYTLDGLRDFRCDPSGAMLCMVFMGFALVIIVPTGAVIGAVVGAASVGTDGTAEVPETSATIKAGSYHISNEDWSIRLTVTGSHFKGTAFCKRSGIPIDFSGKVASDGTIKGIGRGRAYRFYHPSALGPFNVGGHWPVIELDASACKLV